MDIKDYNLLPWIALREYYFKLEGEYMAKALRYSNLRREVERNLDGNHLTNWETLPVTDEITREGEVSPSFGKF